MHFSDTQLLDRFWLSGGGTDTPFLYLRRARMVLSQLSLAYASGDSQQMESWRAVIEYSARLLPDGDERAEQFHSVWDSMHCLAMLDLVLAGIDEKQGNAAYGGLEKVRDIMQKRSERRRLAGLEALDDMELELAFLRTAAIVKWRGEADSDRLLSLAQLRSSLSEDLLPRMRRHYSVRPPQEPYVDSAIMDLVNWTWVLLLRLLLRFDQRAAADELDLFNAQHADFLTLKPGFFRSGISEDGTSPFFWDLEIAKLWLLEELTRGDLELLAEKRSRAFELHCMRHADNGWMRAFLLRETDIMRQAVLRLGQG